SAVDPARLGEYLTDLQDLFGQFGYRDRAAIYGHFGQGCVHVRIPFDLRTGTGIAAFRQFLEQAADLVGSYGGSLSGEHGDGQARGELLPRMFGDEVVGAFGVFKAIFDPDDKMNPGKVSAPRRLDQDLRYGTRWEPRRQPTAFAYPDDEGSFGRAVGRCVGVGECRRHDGGVMCPSYMVTGEEEHSTRGRARLLFEMLNGHPDSAIEDGWRSTEVRDALDLCLSCKGCKQDCPVGVDMATYKAEFTYHHYKGRLRPLSHYSIGWLPVALRVGALAPRAVNAVSRAPGLSRLLSVMAGVDRRRPIPVLAPQTLQAWYADRGPRGSGERGEIVLWPDTFSNNLSPEVGRAAVEVLESAGWRVVVPSAPVCCGLTWISTGQLDAARWMLRRTLDVLRPHLRAGTLIVGIEPSCTAVFRSDARELLGDDPDVLRLAESTVTLAELLTEHTPGWEPPSLPRQVIAQTHCHQHAVMGFTADEQLLARMGTDLDVLDSGCCGLAGNFGFERGHFEISQAVGERVLFPAVRAAPVDAVVLADGYSCRTQLAQGPAGGRGGVHLAELLAAALQQNQPPAGTPPEQTYADRVAAPRTRAGVLVVVVAVGAVAAAAAAGSLVRSRSR
ncbi:MAG TPA: FAD-linked oxidase C-terminal domain-containing protein, partial [Candidatus Nanopelagicales bacterium]|nr:FAD-linked oxidase C-terminal domain-containing protein [Candidatus Nanopelagicales bacterium]